MTSLRRYHASIGPHSLTYRAGRLTSNQSVPGLTYDLLKELEKEETFTAAHKVLQQLHLSDQQFDLAYAWLLFNFVQKLPHLQSHLTVVSNCIRDLTMPNMDVKFLKALAEPKVRAGEITQYLQCFLLPKLAAILKTMGHASLGDTYIESFDMLKKAPQWRDGREELLQCFVYALRAEGDIPSAISAASALVRHLQSRMASETQYDAQVDLLSLHITGIAAFQRDLNHNGEVSKPPSKSASSVDASSAGASSVDTSPTAEDPSSSYPSELRQAFHDDALKAHEFFRSVPHIYTIHQYYLHSLSLLNRYQDVITESEKLIELKPAHKDRFLPWLRDAQAYLDSSQTSSAVEMWPPAIEEGVLPAPTAILETGVLLRYYGGHNKRWTSEQCERYVVALAEHTVATSKKRPFDVSSASAIRAIESALPLWSGSYWADHLEPINKDAHSRLISSVAARYYASVACDRHAHDYADKSIELFHKLWPRLNSTDWHSFGRAYEIAEDFEAALEAFSKTDQPGGISRIPRSILLIKMGRYDDAMELYNQICSEKELYNADYWNFFDCEWGLFFAGQPFSYGSKEGYIIPKQYLDINKAVLHLRRVIDTHQIGSASRRDIFDVLIQCYKTLKDDENAKLIKSWEQESSSYGTGLSRWVFDEYEHEMCTSHLRNLLP